MLFTSYAFLAFVIALFVLYYALPKKCQGYLLLFGSLFFYAFAGISCLFYIAFTILTVFFAALLIDKNLQSSKTYIKEHKEILSKEEKKAYKRKREKARSMILAVAIVTNIVLLAFVKFSGFFLKGLLMPLGISFYMFKSLGYLIDVYRENTDAEKNIFKYALFVSFFPELIQGPISRYGDMRDSLFGGHYFEAAKFAKGIQRILWGYFKKLVVADRLLIAVSTLIGAPDVYRGGYVIILLLFYTIELYADFSGGIDITIGIAECLGINIRENFLRPYFSTSLAEYWRRWHISMCSWFRDYMFYPISTSKPVQNIAKFSKEHIGAKAGRRIPIWISSLIVWLSTGLWHGATLNFIVWGLLNFLVLMISEELTPLYDRFHARFKWAGGKPYTLFMMLRTFVLVCIMNLFDCFVKVGDTLSLLFSIFSKSAWTAAKGGNILELGLDMSDYIVLITALIVMLAVSIFEEKNRDNGLCVRDMLLKRPYAVRFLLFSLLFASIIVFGIYGIGYDASQFIYNRF